MTKDEYQKLEVMVDQLSAMRSRLDLRRANCNECGLSHYTNKAHWHLAEKLDGAIGRLIKILEDHSSPSATQGESHAKTDSRD